MSKLYQINEEDLEVLERALPEMYQSLGPEAKNRRDIQEHVELCKKVLSNVRWEYGPYTQSERVE